MRFVQRMNHVFVRAAQLASRGVPAALIIAALFYAPTAAEAQSTLTTVPQLKTGERPEDRVRDLERQQRSGELQGRPISPIEVPAGQTPADASAQTVKFKVSRIAVSQTAVLPIDRLRALIAAVEGREVVLEDLNQLVRAITQLYQDVGFPVGFAILPPQKVENGVVQIVLIEPRVDTVDVENARYTDPDYLRDRIPLKSGDLVDVYALERALVFLGRTTASGLQFGAKLVPGDDFATSRIVIIVVEPPRHVVTTTTDNYGTRDTGVTRSATSYRNAALTGRDDPLAVGISFSRGSKSTFGIYNAPIGIEGTRLETQYSLSEGRVVDGSFADLDLETEGQFGALLLSHPFFVSREWVVSGLLEGAFSHGRTVTGPLVVGTAIGRAAVGARVVHYSESGTIEFVNKLVGIRARAYNNLGAEYDSYVKYDGELNFVRYFGWLTAIGEFAWQWTPDDLLPSAEQFAIGGESTLRAYAINQFNGDQGFIGNLELHASIPGVNESAVMRSFDGALSLFAFAEGGGAIPYRATGDKIRREDFASDIGLGLNISLSSGKINGRISVAHSLDSVHGPLLEDDPKVLMEMSLKLDF